MIQQFKAHKFCIDQEDKNQAFTIMKNLSLDKAKYSLTPSQQDIVFAVIGLVEAISSL